MKKYLFTFGLTLLILFLFQFAFVNKAQAQICFSSSSCGCNQSCLLFCTDLINCGADLVPFCNGPFLCNAGFHYENHACVTDLVCDDSNRTLTDCPDFSTVIPGQNLGCSASCGAACKDAACTAAGGTCGASCECITPTPTPTPPPPPTFTPTPPPPTPTPIPCGIYGTCGECLTHPACNWAAIKEGPGFCQSLSPICPNDYSDWRYFSCAVNECSLIPTPTPPCPGCPTPTPIPPTPTPPEDDDGDGIPNSSDTEGPPGNGNGVGGSNDCTDGVDNDGDGRIDAADPGCAGGPPPTLTPTPAGCGDYDTPLGGGLSCNGGGFICNHCGECIPVVGNSCEAAGYVCVNVWSPGGSPGKTCDIPKAEGIVFEDLNSNGKKDTIPPPAEVNFTGGIFIFDCSLVDEDGNPICFWTGNGAAAITVQKATLVFVCDDYDSDDGCLSSHYDYIPGAIAWTTTNQNDGFWKVGPLQKGAYIVTITPPLGSVGTGAVITSFSKFCWDPFSVSNCVVPGPNFNDPRDKILSHFSVGINLPPIAPSQNIYPPQATSWTTVDFGISVPIPTPTPTLTLTPTPTATPIPAPPAWFQSVGLNMRVDAGFDDPLPAGQFASITGTGGTPGIIFSGIYSPSFGAGQASALNWQTDNFPLWKQDLYVTRHNSVPTSYDFLLGTAQVSGIALRDLSDFCDIDNCNLPAGFEHNIYEADNDLEFNSHTFGANQDYIILVKGNLTIKGPIFVDIGSTVVFSAKGNINIDKGVVRIEGLYSADKDFKVEGTIAGPDAQLTIAGTAIANASLSGGSFKNERNLGALNSTTPSVRFTERPDFIVNYPDFVKQEKRVWQEVAP